MAFTRDFDDTAPVDHTLNSSWPTKIRNVKTDLGDRLSAIISGFVSGETVKGILALPFIAVSKPATITDQIQLYGKVVSTKTELHAVDEDGNEIQFTSGGGINATALKGVYPSANVAALATMMNFIYPVGIVITLGVSTNPNTLLGIGTWTAIAGRVIVGIDAGQTEFDTLNETGGSKTHTLSTSEVPSLNISSGSIQPGAGTINEIHGYNNDATAFSVLNPYIVKYVWQRTA